MRIRQHGRFDYAPIGDRADYDWPGGCRLAFYVAVNIEHFSFGEGLGHTPTMPGPQPDIRNFGWREYGLRVGIWRLFDLFEEFGLPASHLMNAAIYDHAPAIPARIRARGDEFVGHAVTNSEAQGEMPEAEERALIATTNDAFRRHEGRTPAGWLGPWISESATTLDLLREAGYRYVLDWAIDDQPVWMRTRAGRILAMPYPIEINDTPAMLSRRHTAIDFADMIVDHFDEMLELSTRQPLVCGLSLHTFCSGVPFRLRQLRRALRHITAHPDRDRVWITRPGAIAEYIETLPRGIVPGDAAD